MSGMDTEYFSNIFADLSIPVLVCKNKEDLPVVYMNIRAALLFSPSYSVEELKGNEVRHKLAELLAFKSE